MLKQTQQAPRHSGIPPQGTAAKERPAERPLPTTAMILARGISLSAVQQAVRQLKPHIWQAG